MLNNFLTFKYLRHTHITELTYPLFILHFNFVASLLAATATDWPPSFCCYLCARAFCLSALKSDSVFFSRDSFSPWVKFKRSVSDSTNTRVLPYDNVWAMLRAASIRFKSKYAGFFDMWIPKLAAAIASPYALMIVIFFSCSAFCTKYSALYASYWAICFSSIARAYSLPKVSSVIETSST